MSQNFYALLETRELNSIFVPEIVWESCNDLLSLIDTEEDMNKLYEYTELLRDKKLKKSLEAEISEALAPLLEKNTILYGSFLYDTAPLHESCCENAHYTLSQLRELLGSEFIAEALTPKRVANLKRSGKIAAGVGAAGLAGAGGLEGTGRYLQKRGLEQHLAGKSADEQIAARELYNRGGRLRLTSSKDFYDARNAMRGTERDPYASQGLISNLNRAAYGGEELFR
jgi:hypothetical protein